LAESALTNEKFEHSPLEIPKFVRPASLRGFAMANILTGLAIWLAQFLWKTLFGELFMNAGSWLTSVYVPDIYEVTTTTALYYLEEGTAMFDAYRGLITISLIVAGVLWLLLAYRKTKAVASLCIVMLVGTTALAPSPATALELKRDDNVVTVSASEVIDDTLIAAGDTVLVKGTINGDLVAGGRRIDIAGTVKGNVFAFAESVTISGSVEGMVVSALIAGLLIL
jgi:hypothetical protein